MTLRLWRHGAASLHFNRPPRRASSLACCPLPYLLQWDNVKKLLQVAFIIALTAVSSSTAFAQSAPSQPTPAPAHALYESLNALRVNSDEVYSLRDFDLRHDALHFTFIQGQFAFLKPFQGKITGAVFSGRGRILAVPRDPAEKASIARFLGAPLVDQEFQSVYMRFDDDTAAEILSQLHEAGVIPQGDPGISDEWDSTVASLNGWHSLRILTDLLSEHPLPYFYAGVLGASTGPFDALVDERRREQVVLGQPKTVNGYTSYDFWTSFARPREAEPAAPFVAERYTLDTTVQPDLELLGNATITLHAAAGGDRIVPLELGSPLRVESVTDESNHALEFFQNAPAIRQEIAVRGDDSLTVVLPQAAKAGETFRLHFTYRGHIINQAVTGVFFVGEHGSWYPHISGIDTFTSFDLNFRWPHQLQLVATGEKIDERENGDWREAHWRSEKPIFVAGFNLGAYRVVNVDSAGVKIDLYANAQLNQALQPAQPTRVIETPVPTKNALGNVVAALDGKLTVVDISPDAAAVLRKLGDEIGQATQFFSKYGGPFPYKQLEVSQIPGNFGQGWPGLIYLPTFSFLSREAQRRLGLNVAHQDHFTEIVPYHEVAHQWWGNLVVWHSYRDQWICEGLANYVSLLFADSRKDSDHALNVWLDRYRNSLLSRLPGKDNDIDFSGPLTLGYRLNSSVNPDGYEEIVYAKATWVFHMLRMMLREPLAKDPDGRFVALLRGIAESHHDAALTTDDLQTAVEKVMLPSMDLEGGHSMAWFFDQYVRGTGIPAYKVDFTVQHAAAGEQYVVKGVLHQSGVPQDFLARVPLYVSYTGGKPILLGHVTTSGADTPFRFTTHVSPRHVLVDPELTLLCVTDLTAEREQVH
jgi:hypothetical protein